MIQKNLNEEIKIVFTGGHAATSGLAVINRLREVYGTQNLDLSWIGSKKAIEGSGVSTLEYKIFPSYGVKFFALTAGKIQTKLTRYTLISILKIPVGFIQSFFLLLKIRPRVIMSFGGYASFPVVFWGWILRIPVILHEQTIAAGRASIASAFFSTKIAISRLESEKYFPKNKVVFTGNPINDQISSIPKKSTIGKPPTILITGGSRGSEFINEEIVKSLPILLKKYKLIHVTGDSHFEKIKHLATKNYEIYSSVDPSTMAQLYNKSDIVIARSGANTVSELIAINRPSILIPLPRTFMDEQVKNAQYAKSLGIAKVLTEEQVNPDSLEKNLSDLVANWKVVTKGESSKKSPDIDAAKKIVELLSVYF